jgi:hypothetical protein
MTPKPDPIRSNWCNSCLWSSAKTVTVPYYFVTDFARDLERAAAITDHGSPVTIPPLPTRVALTVPCFYGLSPVTEDNRRNSLQKATKETKVVTIDFEILAAFVSFC